MRQATNQTKPRARPRPGNGKDKQPEWDLRLYIAGHTPRSVAALHNLEQVCEEHLKGRYRISVVDLMVNPQLSRDDQILAVPTLVRKLPAPLKKIIGDLSNQERVLVGLQLRQGG